MKLMFRHASGDARHRWGYLIMNKILQIIILLILIFTCFFLVFSLGLIIFSFVINGGSISLDEIMEIMVFCFKLFSLGSPLILLSIFISNKIRK